MTYIIAICVISIASCGGILLVVLRDCDRRVEAVERENRRLIKENKALKDAETKANVSANCASRAADAMRNQWMDYLSDRKNIQNRATGLPNALLGQHMGMWPFPGGLYGNYVR